MKFNASILKRWMDCPLQVYYADVNPTTREQSAAMTFGTIVHEALELYNTTFDVEQAVERFLYVWENPEELGVAIDYWPGKTSYADYKKMGVGIVEAFHEKTRLKERTVISTEHPFCVPLGDHVISGVVDLLELTYDKDGWPVLEIKDFKGLPLDTKLPTPNGWTTIGDVIVGDEVLGSDGSPCRVLNKSSVHHNPCYRIVFDDGTSIVADHEHRWPIMFGVSNPTLRVMSTEELVGNLKRGKQSLCRVINAKPIDLPEKDLPMDPYLLGYWLGDRTSAAGAITGTQESFDHFTDAGFNLTIWESTRQTNSFSFRVEGLYSSLNELGLLKNKSIPNEFLRGSIEQRLALLRGLMDSDGTYNTLRNQAVFINTNEALIDQVVELVASLGWKPYKWTSKSFGFGKQGKQHRVIFTPFGLNPFSLQRKADLVVTDPAIRSSRRVIQSVEQVPMVPTQCIEVDSSDHTYLWGERFIPTHNTNSRKPTKLELALDIQFTIYQYASLQPEFWLGNESIDPKYKPIEDGAEWFEIFKDANAKRKLVWWHLRTKKEIDCGPRDNADFQRMYRLVMEVVNAVDKGVFVPSIKADSCNWCPFTEECIAIGPDLVHKITESRFNPRPTPVALAKKPKLVYGGNKWVE